MSFRYTLSKIWGVPTVQFGPCSHLPPFPVNTMYWFPFYLNIPSPLLPPVFSHALFPPPGIHLPPSQLNIPVSLIVTSSRRPSLSSPWSEHPMQASPLPIWHLSPCLFILSTQSLSFLSISTGSQCLISLSHPNVSSRRTGTLAILLIILITAPSTVPGSMHVEAINNQSIKNSTTWWMNRKV